MQMTLCVFSLFFRQLGVVILLLTFMGAAGRISDFRVSNRPGQLLRGCIFIGSMFIELARQDARRHQANLPDRDLAYFEKYIEPSPLRKFKNAVKSILPENIDKAVTPFLGDLQRKLGLH